MPKNLLGLTVAAALLATPGLAQALTLVNQDRDAYQVTIIEEPDEEARTYVLQPDGDFTIPCRWSCSVTVGDGEEVDVEGYETLAIRHGKLVVADPRMAQHSSESPAYVCHWLQS